MTKRLIWPNPLSGRTSPLADAAAALPLIASLKDDIFGMRALRKMLLEWGLGTDVSRLTDDEVLAEIAYRISTGQIGLAGAMDMETGGSSGEVNSPPSAPLPAAAPLRPGPASPEPEAPTFGPNLNGAAQAAVLAAAAAAGAPFCET